MTYVIKTRFRDGTAIWLAYSHGVKQPEYYMPNVIRFQDGSFGFRGKTPFEALYRMNKYADKTREE